MDQRSKNRTREHAGHGWSQSDGGSVDISGRVLMQCPCGWFGWIDEEAQK
jgi:hypothetical protein